MNIENIDQITKEKKKGDYFKIKEGANKIRIVSDMKHMTEYFNNNPENPPTDKWVCYVVHYETDKESIKLARFPHMITRQIDALSKDPDWSWEGSVMPFVITINAKNAGTKEVNYTITPSPKQTELSSEIAEELKGLDIDKTVTKLKEYRDKKLAEYISENKIQTDLPTYQPDEEDEEEEDSNVPF